MLLVKVSEQLTVDVLCTCLCCAFFAQSWLCEFTICLWFCMCKTHFAYYDSLMVVRRYGAASCLLCICQ